MKFAILTVLLLVATGSDAAADSVTDISQETLLTNPPKGVLVLDVRSANEFAAGHVPNAVNIPHDQLASRIAELSVGTTGTVVVYCESGFRAGKAATVLRQAGYQNILHLAGDMRAWRANGRPTVKP